MDGIEYEYCSRPTHGHGLVVHNLGRAQNCLGWGPLRNGADGPINLYFNHWFWCECVSQAANECKVAWISVAVDL
jgi:hypothetical protein